MDDERKRPVEEAMAAAAMTRDQAIARAEERERQIDEWKVQMRAYTDRCIEVRKADLARLDEAVELLRTAYEHIEDIATRVDPADRRHEPIKVRGLLRSFLQRHEPQAPPCDDAEYDLAISDATRRGPAT